MALSGAGTLLRKKISLATVLYTALTASVFAADKESAGELANDEAIEEITVVGRWENLLGKSMSASAGVFGQTEIAERPILRTGEIMELVPGMVMTQHSGSGKSNQMFLRGFNLDHGTDFATWVDGMPVNMRTHGHGQGYTDVNFLIEELVERVCRPTFAVVRALHQLVRRELVILHASGGRTTGIPTA